MVPVSDPELALIDWMAEAEQRTRAAMFRILVAEAVKARENNDPVMTPCTICGSVIRCDHPRIWVNR